MSKDKKYKLDISRVLYATDNKNYNFYSNLTQEEKKAYSPLVVMRFLSSAQDQSGLHSYYLNAVNEYVNNNFWELSKHPELQHKLMAAVGFKHPKVYHKWISVKNGSKSKDTILHKFLKEVYEGANTDEISFVLKNITRDELSNLLKKYAKQDNEIKEMLKIYDRM